MIEVKSPFPQGKYKIKKKTLMKFLTKSIVYAFAMFGILVILLLFAVLGLINKPIQSVSIPESAVLFVDLDDIYSEVRQDSLLTEIAPVNSLSFFDLLSVLSYAANDDKIKALAVKINQSGLGLAQIQELHRTVLLFRNRGKHTFIFAPGFGNMGGGTKEYYLASAFDEITMLPNSELGLTGIAAEVPFVRKLLDKVGVTPEFFTRYEYKNAMASFVEEKISPEFKQSMQKLINKINAILVYETLENRFSDPKKEEIISIVDEAPLSAKKAHLLGLIDNVAYETDWRDKILQKYEAKPINLQDYAFNLAFNTKGAKLAILVLEGVISDKASVSGVKDGEISVDAVLRQINKITEDKDVVGILVRINSPGGSYNASNEIWYALNKLKKEKNVPLVVSMGDYAASGGYFIALSGDKILASSATITGSIGVLGGKFVLEELWQKLGIGWEKFEVSPNAMIGSPNFKFTQSQKQQINNILDNIYEDFTLRVSKARKIDIKDIDAIARGRVFCGEEALEKGLIDKIGGFDDALIELKNMAEISSDERLVMDIYPRPRSLQEKIADLIKTSPVLESNKIKSDLGLDINITNMIKHFQHDAIMPMVVIRD